MLLLIISLVYITLDGDLSFINFINKKGALFFVTIKVNVERESLFM